MRLAYLCVPQYSSRYGRYALRHSLIPKLGEWVVDTQECVPVMPHMLLALLGDDFEYGPEISETLMDKCDVMFIYGGSIGETDKMREEQEYWNYVLNRHNTMHYVSACTKCGEFTIEEDFAECGNGFCPDCCEKCVEPRGCQYADESEGAE